MHETLNKVFFFFFICEGFIYIYIYIYIYIFDVKLFDMYKWIENYK